jgi:hypothetical protein
MSSGLPGLGMGCSAAAPSLMDAAIVCDSVEFRCFVNLAQTYLGDDHPDAVAEADRYATRQRRLGTQ